MPESYGQLMVPLYLRLGGDGEHLMAEQCLASQYMPQNGSSQAREEKHPLLAIAHRLETHLLEEQILAHVYAQSPRFFEAMIVDLLLALGYANRSRDLTHQLGRSHDGGVDGMISQD